MTEYMTARRKHRGRFCFTVNGALHFVSSLPTQIASNVYPADRSTGYRRRRLPSFFSRPGELLTETFIGALTSAISRASCISPPSLPPLHLEISR